MNRHIATYLIAVFFFGACKKENSRDCFKSTGRDVSETRLTDLFKQVEVWDKIDVTILKGAEYKVELVAGSHLLSNITTRVKDGVLLIENRNRCNFVRGYKRTIRAIVTAPYITRVINNGVGTITFSHDYAQDTLIVRAESSGDIHIHGTYNQLRTSSHGNGDVYLYGTCNTLFVYTNGTNFLYGRDMIVNGYAFVETLSLGDCFINATRLKSLEYNIWSAGNLYYSGAPTTLKDVGNGESKGSGRAMQKD